MSSMTFVINDDSIGAREPRVRVTITENDNGTLTFDIEQLTARGAYIGDLRGFFFDIGDEQRIGSLSVSDVSGGQLTDFEQSNDRVRSLGHGADMHGLLGTGGTSADPNNNRGYDVGLEIGTAWRGRNDDVRAFHFTLSSADGPLTLDDFSNVDFGIRVQSVGRDRNGDGTIDTFRWGGAKIIEKTFDPLNAADDAAGTIEEGATATGNVFGNDVGPGTKILTGITYKGTTTNFPGAAPIVVLLTDDDGNATGATVTIFADGSYIIDATQAGVLSSGQQLDFDIAYQVKQTVLETNGSLAGTAMAEAHLTGTVLGVGNEAPVVNTPSVTLAVPEDQSLAISGFSITDDSASLTVMLTGNSVLTLGRTAGLTFVQGDGTADETMTFSGSLADINAALDGLVYGPTPDFSGVGFVFYLVDDGENVTVGSLGIDVAPDADAPMFTIAEPPATTPLPATREVRAEAFTQSGTPTIAALAGGGFVLVWATSTTDVEISSSNYAQLFDAQGQPRGHAFVAGVGGGGGPPAVVALDDGGFVVISTRPDFDGNVFAVGNIYGQRYDADGVAAGSAFRINVVPSASPSSVSALADGGFVVTWRALDQDGGGIFARRYDASTAPVGGQFQINTTTEGSQWDPVAVGLADGGFIATWNSPDQNGDGVFAQRFDQAGVAVGGEFRVNTTTGGHQDSSATAALAGGGFVVTWLSHAPDSPNGDISVQLYDASGALLGGEFVVETNSTATKDPAVVALPDGGFIVAWNAASQDSPGDAGGIYARRFDANGEAVGEEFRVNESVQGIQAINADGSDQVLAVLASGELAATWVGERDDSFGGIPDVFARLFAIDRADALEGAVVTLPAITAALSDIDGSETLKLVLGGFAEGTTFSKGHAEGTTWVIDNAADIAALDDTPLTMTAPVSFSGGVTLTVQAVVTDTATLSTGTVADATSATDEIAIDIAPAADAPVLTIAEPEPTTPLPLTGEFSVNALPWIAYRHASTVAALEDGGFVVAWNEGNISIIMRRYGPDHQPIGGEITIDAIPVARDPSITALDDGGFIVAWSSFGLDNVSGDVFAQRFDSSGVAVGDPFQINTTTAGDQQSVAIAALDDGGLVVTWTSVGQDGDSLGVYGQRYDAAGAPIGGEFQVSTTTAGAQFWPAVTARDGGGFVVTWTSNPEPGGTASVFGQRYDATGAPDGAEFRINADPSISAAYATVATLAGGGFVVTWMSREGNLDTDIHGRLYDALGNAVGDEFVVALNVQPDQSQPFVAALPDGGFAVAWNSLLQDDPASFSGNGVYAQRFDANGSPVGSEFLVNETAAGDQRIAENVFSTGLYPLAVLSSGALIATWSGEPFGPGGPQIFARMFSIDGINAFEDQLVALPPITASLGDTDGSEALTLVLSGFPAGATFSAGALDSDPSSETFGKWVISDPAVIASLDDDPLVMTPPADFSGRFTLQVAAVAADTATLSTGSVTDTASVTRQIDITIIPGPAVDAPGTAPSTVEDQSVAISGFSVADDDHATLTVTLNATSLLTLSTTAGLTFAAGDGTADQVMTFSGSIAAINAALDGLVYDPTADFGGAGNIAYSFDNGVDVTRGSFYVDVAPVADAPVLDIADAAPGTPMPLTGESKLSSFQFADGATVAALEGGGFVTVWSEFFDAVGPAVVGQRFDADGQNVGFTFPIAGGSFDEPVSVAFASVVSLDGGGFAVVWQQTGSTGDSDIFAARYDASGVRIGEAFRVNGSPEFSQSYPSFEQFADGGLVVTWSSEDQDGDALGIYGQRYDETGASEGGEFKVSTTTAGDQFNSSVATFADGGFVVTWSSQGQDGDGFGVYGRRYDATGAAEGGEFQVNTTVAGNQLESSVVALAGGGFVVTLASDQDIFARVYDSSGDPLGAAFLASTNAVPLQVNPSIVALPDGGFIIGWNSIFQDSPDGSSGVYGQRFDANGNAIGDEFRISQMTDGSQQISFAVDHTMAILESGELVATWNGESPGDPNGGPPPEWGTFMRKFTVDNEPVQGEPFWLPPITAAVRDADGSEALKLVLSGFPDGATFSAGALDTDPESPTLGQWVILDPAAIASIDDVPLVMTPPANFSGAFLLDVTAVITDTAALSTGNATDTTSVTQRIEINIRDVNDPLIATNEQELAYFTIEGMDAGAIFREETGGTGAEINGFAGPQADASFASRDFLIV